MREWNRDFRACAIFLLAMLPAILAMAVVAVANQYRGREAMREVGKVVCRFSAHQEETLAAIKTDDSSIVKEFAAYLAANRNSLNNVQELTGKCEGEKIVPGTTTAPPAWATDALFVSILVLIPFAIIAGRIAMDERQHSGGRKSPFVELAARSFWMKFIVASAAAWGWIYVLYPYGQGTGAIQAFLKYSRTIASNSAPLFLTEPLRPVTAAFLGWYVNFWAYAFYRARRDDVRSARVYGVVLRKLLIALAVGSALSIDEKSTAACVVALTVGLVPGSLFAVLRDYGVKGLGGARDPSATLMDLPGISPWEVARLEEEGVDSIASLVTADKQQLRTSMPTRDEMIDHWYDMAALMIVVGPERYQKLRDVCITASGFIQQSRNEAFRVNVQNVSGIQNTAEIASILEARFANALPRRGEEVQVAAAQGEAAAS